LLKYRAGALVVLQRPVLYLSHYLKQHRGTYYDRLMAVRYEGDWEGWLRFFLTGVATVAREAEQTARQIVELRRDAHAADASVNTLKLMDYLFEQPVINVKAAQEWLGVSFPAAGRIVSDLQNTGVLTEITGGRRNRMFRFVRYLDLFADVAETTADGTAAQPTQYADADG
jgi:Fic family protein